jgi:hypothetical protein
VLVTALWLSVCLPRVQVSNRRAWFDVDKLTPEVLSYYKRPLTAKNWDVALVEVQPRPWHRTLARNPSTAP